MANPAQKPESNLLQQRLQTIEDLAKTPLKNPETRKTLRSLILKTNEDLTVEMEKLTSMTRKLKADSKTDPKTESELQEKLNHTADLIDSQSRHLLNILRVVGEVELSEFLKSVAELKKAQGVEISFDR